MRHSSQAEYLVLLLVASLLLCCGGCRPIFWNFQGALCDGVPETCEEASTMFEATLSDKDKELLRHSARWNWFAHRAIDTGPMVDYGVWADNRGLYKSCAEMSGEWKPGGAATKLIIIDSIWRRLNADLPQIEWDALEPIEQFQKVHQFLNRAYAEKNDRLLNVLPPWVFHSEHPNMYTKRDPSLTETAIQIAQSESELAYLGLLYLSYYPSKENIYLFNLSVEKKIPVIPYPNESDEIYYRRFRDTIGHEPGSDEIQYSEYYSWKEYTLGEFSLALLAEGYGAKFDSVEKYRVWQNLLEENDLFRWSRKQYLTPKDIDDWINRPLELLKVIYLSGRYLKSNGFGALPTECYRHLEDTCDAIGERLEPLQRRPPFMNETNHFNTERRCPKDECKPMKWGDWSKIHNDDCWHPCKGHKASPSLIPLADTIPVEDLLQSISPEAHREFQKIPFSETLGSFEQFALFVILTVFDRANTPQHKDRLWTLSDYYIQQRNRGFFVTDTFLDVQFKLDESRTLQRITEVLEAEIESPVCERKTGIITAYKSALEARYQERYSGLVEKVSRAYCEHCKCDYKPLDEVVNEVIEEITDENGKIEP